MPPRLRPDQVTRINPHTATLLRERLGLSKGAFAAALNRPPSFISQTENHSRTTIPLRTDVAIDYADTLNVTIDALTSTIPTVRLCDRHSTPRNVPAARRRQIDAVLTLRTHTIVNHVTQPPLTLPAAPTTPNNVKGVALASADLLRKHLDNPESPLHDLPALAEAHGVLIAPWADGEELTTDAVVARADGADTPVVYITPHGTDTNRQRFALAHALGHIVMDTAHPAANHDQAERRANIFAGELLAPHAHLEPFLRGVTPRHLPRLLDTATTWGIDPKRLLTHAHTVGYLNGNQRRYWAEQCPHPERAPSYTPIYPFAPTRLTQAITALTRQGVTFDDLSETTGFYPTELATLLSTWPTP